ncbi:hypothetical protein BC829DRAFT_419981 [Chytridium lagenaria]|nr:hypothetical protein BC829DRAFT_419981 [Chytridium lagenaria]
MTQACHYTARSRRILAIIADKNGDFTISESGAILLYLAEHFDTGYRNLYSESPKPFNGSCISDARSTKTLQSLYFRENSNAIRRYHDETVRLYEALQYILADGREYIAMLRDHEFGSLILPLVQKWFFN